jgi:hypothetical protein
MYGFDVVASYKMLYFSQLFIFFQIIYSILFAVL